MIASVYSTIISRASQRAFVVANDLSITPIMNADNTVSYWEVAAVIENAGNTSTRDLNVYSGVWWEDLSLYEKVPSLRPSNPDAEEWEFHNKSPNRWDLGPKAKITTPPYIISNELAERLREKPFAIFIFGTAFYYDVVGGWRKHKTKFCYRLFGWKGDTDNIGKYGTMRVELPKIAGLSSRPCVQNNCTDDECPPEQPAPAAP
jgi:hypothetical protein